MTKKIKSSRSAEKQSVCTAWISAFNLHHSNKKKTWDPIWQPPASQNTLLFPFSLRCIRNLFGILKTWFLSLFLLGIRRGECYPHEPSRLPPPARTQSLPSTPVRVQGQDPSLNLNMGDHWALIAAAIRNKKMAFSPAGKSTFCPWCWRRRFPEGIFLSAFCGRRSPDKRVNKTTGWDGVLFYAAAYVVCFSVKTHVILHTHLFLTTLHALA